MSEPSFSVAILYLVHGFPLWTVIHLFIKTLVFLKDLEAHLFSKNPVVAFYTKDIIQIASQITYFQVHLIGGDLFTLLHNMNNKYIKLLLPVSQEKYKIFYYLGNYNLLISNCNVV